MAKDEQEVNTGIVLVDEPKTMSKTDRRAAFLARAVPPETMGALVEAHAMFFGVLNDAGLSVPERTVMTAHAITELKAALDGPILDQVIMPLMNSPIGFDTDRNPAKTYGDKKPAPYGRDVVLNCTISAWLMGLALIGNRWNIIASGMYARKEGYEDLLSVLCKYSAFADVPPIPQPIYLEGGYLKVPVTIQYKLHSSEDDDENGRFHASYKVRVNKRNAVGVEASEGKAKRKAYRDLLKVLTGVMLHDADVDDMRREVFQVGAHHGDAPSSKSDQLADQLKTGDPPWETLSTDGVQELRRRIAAQDKLDEAALTTALGHEDVTLEQLPKDCYTKAISLLG